MAARDDIKARRQAERKARKYSREYGCTVYVVWDGGRYETCRGFDLDTFYAGLEPLFAVEQD